MYKINENTTIQEIRKSGAFEKLLDVSATINDLQTTAKKYNWGQRYIDAIKDIKKSLGIKNTVFELFTNQIADML